MKKFICILTAVLLTLAIIWYGYNLNKCRDFNYAVDRYFTSGILNKYKLYNIDKKQIYFSNGNVSFLKVDGISARSPHEKINYTVFIKRNSSGIWKIEKVYPDDTGGNQ
ncbi:MAG: hypothetical protein LKE46_12145 [Clostridium sp.]|jgi:hypothetical protein|uniref:hypothetical protein n=1 Tax=Clostridium sp. TaxID=1506 RepID=UPI0025BFE038|nr:hypothetical protein [Clostridium sp.]MCH3965011.1 hypothetical protein [Clostridium sp.]MCI1714232.1 hypothetical protein [Clostridium sp.]MCI1798494.1 hypothetical protein [Clostridium sp.]MCI1812775.1 hypothetical protein [Clostridium sp.]MCI1869303.1 hypothetical protein [Clostridium sp.]